MYSRGPFRRSTDPETIFSSPVATSISDLRLTTRQQHNLVQLRNKIPKLKQQRGRELYQTGANLSLKRSDNHLPGSMGYVAVVRDQIRREVFIEFVGNEVTVDCDCEESAFCKHCYCGIQSLLARASIEDRATDRPARDLIAALESAHARRLTPPELDYIERIETAYANATSKPDLTVYDLRGLLPSSFGGGTTRVEIWPDPPTSLLEFWHYVAHAISSKKGNYPPFLDLVTDPELIVDKVRGWARRKEIAVWNDTFGRLASDDALQRIRVLDLRIHIETNGFSLESRLDGLAEFTPLKTKFIRPLQADLEAGLLQLSPAATVLWPRFAPLLANDSFTYREAAACAALEDMLRLPFIRENIVALDGSPIEFPTEPLRWSVTANDDDYDLQLVTATGQPPLRLLARFAGPPALYLTVRQVFPGPPITPEFSAADSLRIPSEALETLPGIQTLLRLDAPLPEKIAGRVRRIPLHLHLTATLHKPRGKKSNPENDPEYLRLAIHSADGTGREFSEYLGSGWSPLPAGKAASVETGNDFLEIVDPGTLPNPAPILDGLAVAYDEDISVWSCKITRRFPAVFSSWLQNLPPTIVLDLDSTLASFRERPLTAKFDLEILEAGVDWFDLRSTLKIEDTDLTREEITLLLKASGEYVRLGTKGWRKLAFELSPEDDAALAQIGLSTADLNGESQRMHVLQLAGGSKARHLLPEDTLSRIAERVAEIKTRVAPPVPSTIHATLRPYQLEGYHFLSYLAANQFGGILADDMGLGKTLQTLVWLASLREDIDLAKRTTLVVCPKSVTDNWLSEAERFYPTLKVGVWREKNPALLTQFISEHDLVVLNYAQLRSHEIALAKVRWLAVILDEGQFIKNPTSQTANAARNLDTDHRLILTGTPIENRLLDLWSLMSFAMPGILGTQSRFQVLFNEKKDALATRRLAARVRPFLLRRSKKEVATDLPDRIEEDLHCEMEGDQLLRYRAELKIARQRLLKINTSSQLDKERFNILTSLLRLRQICAHPGLADPKLSDADSAKQEALFELLEPLIEEGHKVLVFSQFVSMLERLQTVIREREWKSYFLAGDTEDRGQLVKNFQADPGSAVFLISLRAGGFGLNLTSASYVVLYDPWWNPAVENQAIDRTHRIGQVNKVIAYRLITKDSIEEKIRALQKSKGALAQDILGEENFVKSLTLDDFQYLFAES